MLDSGLVPRGSELPEIAISALTDGFCFQEGVSIVASPSAYSIDVAMIGNSDVTWTVAPDASSYDVVDGDLAALRAGAGAPGGGSSNAACLANDVQGTSAVDTAPLMPGEVRFFLVRGAPGPDYDSGGAGQAGSRGWAADACP